MFWVSLKCAFFENFFHVNDRSRICLWLNFTNVVWKIVISPISILIFVQFSSPTLRNVFIIQTNVEHFCQFFNYLWKREQKLIFNQAWYVLSKVGHSGRGPVANTELDNIKKIQHRLDIIKLKWKRMRKGASEWVERS